MSDRLTVRKLRVVYGSRVAVDVEELSVGEGELLVVLGGQGGGKSSLAAAVAGAVASSGSVRLDGRVLEGSPSQRLRQGLAAALRDAGGLRGCTVAEALGLAARGSNRDAEALDRFPQLSRRKAVAAQLLSGGEQQLLRIAAAWSASPRALVLDAPTVGLAADAAAAVTALAREEAERGTAVLWLEQDARAAPATPRLALARGRISPYEGAA